MVYFGTGTFVPIGINRLSAPPTASPSSPAISASPAPSPAPPAIFFENFLDERIILKSANIGKSGCSNRTRFNNRNVFLRSDHVSTTDLINGT